MVTSLSGRHRPRLAEPIDLDHIWHDAALERLPQEAAGQYADVPHKKLTFAVKANPNLAILQVLQTEGYGADIVSAGELERSLTAGMAPRDIVFSGVGKTAAEMLAALDAGIGQFNIESEAEGMVLNSLAAGSGRVAPVAIRVNPDVDAFTHAKISTGRRSSKFGILYDTVPGVAKRLATLPGLRVRGLAVHIGSQLTDLSPLEVAYRRVGALLDTLRAEGLPLDSVDLGGGLGVAYAADDPHPDLRAYGAMVSRVTRDWDVEPIFEPGRLLVAEAGALLTRVTYVKADDPHPWVIVDAGMNDLARPALYGARHRFIPVRRSGRSMLAAIAGPICESSDVFSEARTIDEVAPGDLAIFAIAGAYGAAMASAYNC